MRALSEFRGEWIHNLDAPQVITVSPIMSGMPDFPINGVPSREVRDHPCVMIVQPSLNRQLSCIRKIET